MQLSLLLVEYTNGLADRSEASEIINCIVDVVVVGIGAND